MACNDVIPTSQPRPTGVQSNMQRISLHTSLHHHLGRRPVDIFLEA